MGRKSHTWAPLNMIYQLFQLGYMLRKDQGHLHPNLEVQRLTCPGHESNRAVLKMHKEGTERT